MELWVTAGARTRTVMQHSFQSFVATCVSYQRKFSGMLRGDERRNSPTIRAMPERGMRFPYSQGAKKSSVVGMGTS